MNSFDSFDSSKSHSLYRPFQQAGSSNEIWARGMRAIEANVEALRDDLRDKGMKDGPQMESIVMNARAKMIDEFSRNLQGDFSDPYSPTTRERQEISEINDKGEKTMAADFDQKAIDAWKDKKRQEMGYDEMTDDEKADLDSKLDQTVESLKAEKEKTSNDEGDEDENDDGQDNDNQPERGRDRSTSGNEKNDTKQENTDDDSLKKERAEAAAKANENQRMQDLQRMREQEKDKKDKEEVER